MSESDRIALSFYMGCEGRLLREYRGFRRKARLRRLDIPPIKEFID